ncbi:hypothetical protein O0L34_g10769 [Tuta absoluta]|nr:hypothetical protein O0L34_g10769 [Tuta absoluta]
MAGAQAGVCLSCLSTENLVGMTNTEWTVFDMLLHPISKQYSSIKTNHLAKICLHCQQSMQYIERFRKKTLKNFLFLMNVWSLKKSSMSAPDDDNALNVEAVTANPQPLSFTVPPAANNHRFMPAISSISAVYSHNKNYDIPQDCSSGVKNEEIQPENEEERLADIFTSELVKIEANDDLTVEANIGDPLKEEPNIVDNITEVPIFYKAFDNTTWSKGCTNSVASTEKLEVLHKTNIVDKVIDEEKQFPAVHRGRNTEEKINPAMYNDMDTLLKTMLQMSSYPPKEMQYPSKETVNPAKEMSNPLKETSNPFKRASNPSQETSKPPEETSNPSEEFSCQKCNKIVTSETDLAVHEYRVHRAMSSNCSQCGKTLKNEYTLQVHIMTVHGKKKYCDVCDIYFTASRPYNNHLKWSPKHNNPDTLKASRVSCVICNNTIKNKDLLRAHMNTHPTAKYCQPCDAWFSPANYKIHLKTTPLHVSKEEAQYTCDYCNQTFCIKLKLRDHILVEHMNINPYKCKHCHMEFKTVSPRDRHLRVVHEKRQLVKKYVCDVCGKRWATSSMLRDHSSVHTGARPHACGTCDATFGHKSALYLHNRYKHDKKKCPPKKKKNAKVTPLQ